MTESTLLRLKRITRVDLVDQGASYDPATGEGAHVLIHKRAPEGAGRGQAMSAMEHITKGGTTWQAIEAAAMDMVARSGEKLSAAEAVSRFLGTAPGKRLYDEYLQEQQTVAKRYAQARLAPPDGVR